MQPIKKSEILIFKPLDPKEKVHLQHCPKRLIQYIFSFLSPEELIRTEVVSKKWKLLCNDNYLWKLIGQNHRLFLENCQENYKEICTTHVRNTLLAKHSTLEEKIVTCGHTSECFTAFAVLGNTIFIPLKNGFIEFFDVLTGKYLNKSTNLIQNADPFNIRQIEISENYAFILIYSEKKGKYFHKILKIDLKTGNALHSCQFKEQEKLLYMKQELIFYKLNNTIYARDFINTSPIKILPIQSSDKIHIDEDAIYIEKIDKTVYLYTHQGNFLNFVQFEGQLLLCCKDKIYTYCKTHQFSIQIWDNLTGKKIFDSPFDMRGLDVYDNLDVNIKRTILQGNLLILNLQYRYLDDDGTLQDGIIFFDITKGVTVKKILLKCKIYSFIITPTGKLIVRKKNYPTNLHIYDLLPTQRKDYCTIT